MSTSDSLVCLLLVSIAGLLLLLVPVVDPSVPPITSTETSSDCAQTRIGIGRRKDVANRNLHNGMHNTVTTINASL